MVKKMEDFAAAGRISLAVPYQLHSLIGTGKKLESVTLHSLNGEIMEVETECLLPFFGLAATLGPIADWGLSIDKHAITIDPLTTQTSEPGIYAIGDIASYKNKLKLILTGFHEAALAAHTIRAQLFPDKEFHFEYSTTKGLP
jgi:thioredoxin reductase (NADPH)